MPLFETLDEIEVYVKGTTIPEISKIVKIVGKEVLNERVEKEVYDNVALNTGFTEDFYENTFGLREASEASETNYVDVMEGSGLLIDIYLNPKSKYTAFYGGQDVTDKIVQFLDMGHKGYYKNLTIDYEGRHFFDKAFNDLTKGGKLKKRITEYLKKMGYVISRQASE